MELYERLPLAKIHYLNSLNFNKFKAVCKSSCKNDDARKKLFNRMKSFCETNIKTRGETKRIYSYTVSTPLEVGGRLYCGNSIQGLSKILRGFLMEKITTDIDMKNAHPVILKYLCHLHNIKCPQLDYYVANRGTILIEYGEDAKQEFLKCVNDCKPHHKYKTNYYKAFDKECKIIQQELTSKECYKHIVDCVPNEKFANWYGSAINRILCVYENNIVQQAVNFINRCRGIHHTSLFI